MASVGIIGATGYVGTEIVRLLQNHPDINITSVVSHNFAGRRYRTYTQILRMF